MIHPACSMAEFLEASRGVWLTRRAVHHLDHQDDEFGDSNLVIEPFPASDPAVAEICQALGIDAATAAGEARFWWESNLKPLSRSDDQAAVLVDIPLAEDSRRGFLVRDKGYVEKQPVLSAYAFSEDGVMTVTTRYDTNVGTERCWFVTDQVRMRVSSVQCMDGVAMTTYCTELRCPSPDSLQQLRQQADALAAALR
jgi:hypothetical protein